MADTTEQIDSIQPDPVVAEQHELKRTLGPVHLTMIGIGAIVGAGIFVITGQVAADYAGPAVLLSFVVAALAVTLALIAVAVIARLRDPRAPAPSAAGLSDMLGTGKGRPNWRVLLIGLGDDIAALDKSIRAAFRERNVIVEATATGGAVRTYNVLLGEQRAVGAALIAVERSR